jgi:hypothetical protein
MNADDVGSEGSRSEESNPRFRLRHLRQLRNIDGFDLAVLGLYALVSLWVLGLLLLQVSRSHGQSWIGTDGIYLQDQAQYLAWIRDASHHGLVSNLFVPNHTASDFFQPLVLVAGGLVAGGMAPWVALLLWKPVAVLWIFFAVRGCAHSTVEGKAARRAALVLALFFVGLGSLIGHEILHLSFLSSAQWDGITQDLWLDFWLWGYPFGLIGLAAMLSALLLFARERKAGRTGFVAPLLGALASFLHPWQGEILILVVLACEGISRLRGERTQGFAWLTVCGATAAPLVYLVVLTHKDSSWRLFETATHSSWPLWMIAVSEAPLLLPALLAYRRPPETTMAVAMRAWPIAAVAVFLSSELLGGGFALHAFLGVNIPLAILAVDGLRTLRWPAFVKTSAIVASIAVAVVIIPLEGYQLNAIRSAVLSEGKNVRDGGQFLDRNQLQALNFLATDPRPGAVLTIPYLGTVVPGETGRNTFVGNSYWSPSFFTRYIETAELFSGHFSPADARAFVRQSGARFVLADCPSDASLLAALRPIVRSVHQFGCDVVYSVT